MKKYLFGAACAAIAGATMLLSFAVTEAEARPRDSFQQSCRNIRSHGDSLTALCRRMDGSWARTTMHNTGRCVGGIANSKGRLVCNMGHHFGSSRPPRGQQGPGWGFGR